MKVEVIVTAPMAVVVLEPVTVESEEWVLDSVSVVMVVDLRPGEVLDLKVRRQDLADLPLHRRQVVQKDYSF